LGAVQRAVHELLRLGPDGENGNAGAVAGLEDISSAGERAGSASLRRRPVPPAQREALGKSLRDKVALPSLGEWRPDADRRDPVDQLEDLHGDGWSSWSLSGSAAWRPRRTASCGARPR